MSDAKPAIGIRLQAIAKSYGRQAVLHDLALDVVPGEFISMLGPSGSGKTTILKIIAGFEDPDRGRVFLDDRDMTGVPPERRNIGVVFQNYSLFPHMNVAANVGFPLRMRRMAKDRQRDAIGRALALVALSGYETRMPNQLSGGQQQRVAIARAIVYEPDVLLMDEPLGALDRRLRADLQLEIKALHDRLGLTIVYVTHDQEEALSMSDRVVVFNKGRVEQIGDPRTVYRRPDTLFVADFLGDSISVAAVVVGSRASLANANTEVDLGYVQTAQGNVKLLWRSDQASIVDPPGRVRQDGRRLVVPACVLATAYAGAAMRLRVRLATGDVGIVTADDSVTVGAGATIGVVLDLSTASFLRVAEDGAANEQSGMEGWNGGAHKR
jgi:putative spermidine/putrescine transport system ATP-binding protein